ncbi:MAG: RnfABCDGE type electron transport complex subunit D, partial [Firmicutes bacterium]|nr:RnfABCDGE type electron transport complex subunit D [Bacillota bacterium]
MNKTEVFKTSPPLIKNPDTVNGMMFDVILAVMPSLLWGIYAFGIRVLSIVIVSVITAILTEAVFSFAVNKKIVMNDISSVVTGLLLALILPVSVPLYIPCIGSVFAVGIAKCVFGGLGHNFLNPALAGYAFLMLSFPSDVNVYAVGLSGVTENPTLELAGGSLPTESLYDLLVGRCGGSLGTVSALLIFAGFVYLLIRGTVSWHIPIIYVVTVAALSVFFSQNVSTFTCAASEILSGTLFFGAVFMATDPVTSPTTTAGKVIYGFAAGCVTYMVRSFIGTTDGVA